MSKQPFNSTNNIRSQNSGPFPKRPRYNNHEAHSHTNSSAKSSHDIVIIKNRKSQFDNVDRVVDHYNLQKERNRDDRQKSQTYAMRCFNNWVKQVQIEHSVDQAIESLGNQTNKGLRVLDICCGKGGDQNKWKKKDLVHHIDFVDISVNSINECKKRYVNNVPCQNAYTAKFYVADCLQSFTDPGLTGPYDIVSCQMAIHYAFESCTQAECFMENVSSRLKPGGIFIGTTVNDYEVITGQRRRDKSW